MNRLYYGDNLDVLRRHIEDASVDLVYLDPPFNSNASYNVLLLSVTELKPPHRSRRSRIRGGGTRARPARLKKLSRAVGQSRKQCKRFGRSWVSPTCSRTLQ